jgi:transmembrane sensor
MTDFEHIADLVFRNLSEPLPDGERAELDAWLAASPVHEKWYRRIQEEEHLRQLFLTFRGDQAEASKARVLGRIEAALVAGTTVETMAGVQLKSTDEKPDTAFTPLSHQTPVHRIHFLKTAWFRSIAAAVVIVILGSGAYLWNKQTHAPSIVHTSPVPMQNDVAAPVVTKAMITLADGKQIVLDTAADGTLAVQGAVAVIKGKDGGIVYAGSSNSNGNANPKEVAYNTLTNPRGSRVIALTLADGTTVWLNAESSLRYPTGFTGTTREVEITGEAYFEVTHNDQMPFVVRKEDVQVRVLGTHFNVNAYPNEAAIQVTLLEGSVQVKKDNQAAVLKPGQQAQVAAKNDGTSNATNKSGINEFIQTVSGVNTQEVMAWKNGLFNFNRLTLEQVVGQLARWYDVTPVYPNGVPSVQLRGGMDRQLTLNQVLEGLKDLGMHCRLEGRQLVILP